MTLTNEEALFYNNGLIEEIFTGGKYSLTTGNYAFISSLLRSISGGISTFHCKVYFVNTAHSMELLWGTQDAIQLRDPVRGIPTTLKGRGGYRVKVVDSKKLLFNLIGNNVKCRTPQDLQEYFRNEFLQIITSNIAKQIMGGDKEILGIICFLDELAQKIQNELSETMFDYGLKLINFSISNLTIPLDDPNRELLEKAYLDAQILDIDTVAQNKAKIVTANAEAQITMIDAETQKRAMALLGHDWKDKVMAEVLKTLAENPNSGGVGNTMAGMGLGAISYGFVKDIATAFLDRTEKNKDVSDTYQQVQRESMFEQDGYNVDNNVDNCLICPNCNKSIPEESKFCTECGSKIVLEFDICKFCGNKIPSGSRFCNHCGKPKN